MKCFWHQLFNSRWPWPGGVPARTRRIQTTDQCPVHSYSRWVRLSGVPWTSSVTILYCLQLFGRRADGLSLCRSFLSLWLSVGQLACSSRLMVHLLGGSPGELLSASDPFQLSQLSLTAPLHRGLHGGLQPADRHVYRDPGLCGRSHSRRVCWPWCPLGGGVWLSGHRMGLGVCVRGQRAAADPGSCAVWREYDMCPCLRKVAFPWERPHMCAFLPRSFPHPGFSAAGRGGGVWILTFLSALAIASPLLSTVLLAGLFLSTHHDEHSVFADSNRFTYPPLLRATSRRVWWPVGLRHD